jgi:hypothetical protein
MSNVRLLTSYQLGDIFVHSARVMLLPPLARCFVTYMLGNAPDVTMDFLNTQVM